MSLHFTFRKIESTEALKEHITKKVNKFSKYVTYPMEVHVTLSVEKQFQTAEITCHAEHRDLVAVAKTKDLYESIDMAVAKIESQMKKERERKKGHKSAHLINREGTAERLASDIAAVIPHRDKKSAKAS